MGLGVQQSCSAKLHCNQPILNFTEYLGNYTSFPVKSLSSVLEYISETNQPFLIPLHNSHNNTENKCTHQFFLFSFGKANCLNERNNAAYFQKWK